MQQITRLHVPCLLSYTKLVETYIGAVSESIYSSTDPARNKTVAVVGEVFTNIVKHSQTYLRNDLVRLQTEVESGKLTISIYDSGPGIKLDNQLPPYDSSLITKKKKFRRVVDGTVYVTISSPTQLTFTFEEKENKQRDMLDHIRASEGHGFGISMVTKVMDSFSYSCISDGIFDWKMVKRISH